MVWYGMVSHIATRHVVVVVVVVALVLLVGTTSLKSFMQWAQGRRFMSTLHMAVLFHVK